MQSWFFLHFAQSRLFSVLSGIILAALWSLFAISHLTQYGKTGEISLLLMVLAETLVAVCYLARTNPKSVSTDPVDWILGVAGTFTPLLFRPAEEALVPSAGYVMALGLVLLLAGVISLNRSFAIVAARREIKTKRMYALVRHPIYTSYFLIFTAYLLVNTSMFNVLVGLVLFILLLMRISREENHLLKDQAYADYCRRVRYRLVPFIY